MTTEIRDRPPESASRPVVTGTATVCVACKLPQGHRARLHKWVENKVVNAAGMEQTVRQSVPTGVEYVFKGNAHEQTEGPRVENAGGYGLTFGIPLDFWEAWKEQHKDLDLVRDRLIFAHEARSHAIGIAKDQREIQTGLSRIDPRKKVKSGGVTVEVAEGSGMKFGRFEGEYSEAS